jgi:GT2 family glycosyltransferase
MVNFTMLAHSRPKLTLQALRSLGEFDGNSLVLFDNPDNKEMVDILQDWSMLDILQDWSSKNSNPKRNVYHVAESHGTGWARNEVIRMAETVYGRGDYLYLSDNDVFFYPAIFEKLVPIYEYAWTLGFKVLGAVNHPFHLPIAHYPVYGGGKVVISSIMEVQALALQSMLMRWEVWDEYGPFDNTPVGRVRMSEDVAFTNKIKAGGGKIGVVSPPLVVNTGLTDSFGEKIPGWEIVSKEVPFGVYAE